MRRTPAGLAFAAPPLVRSGPVEEALVEQIAAVLRIDRAKIADAQWADNGPGWVAILLESADAVAGPDARASSASSTSASRARRAPGSPEAFEVRAFFPKDGTTVEDPVTGSLNASLAQWLLEHGPRHGALRRAAGHRARAPGARPRLAATTTARSGSAAAR